MTPNTPPLAVICAENIALLSLLHSVPAPPSHNPIDSLPIRQKGYTLSFLQERSLTGTLAFLSNLKDGPESIPAVCVQEDPDSASLNVLLAVNKARQSDGKEVLQNLKSGFEKIFALLSQVTDDVVEDRIFTAVVSMCSVRILCRLRFISNSRKAPRQPIKELLQKAVTSIRRLENKTVRGSKVLLTSTLFVETVKEVIKLVDAWVKHRTPTRLEELVQGMHRLWGVGELQGLLSAIPNQSMNPSSKKNLLNIISKVARYREAARFLYRTAKKFLLVRQMKILLVSLPPNVFQRIPANQYTPTLSSTISRISAPHGQRWNISHICRLLNVSEVEASDRLAQQTRKTLKDAKIHAEIQLLFCLELEISRLPPRVSAQPRTPAFFAMLLFICTGRYIPRDVTEDYTPDGDYHFLQDSTK